MMSTQWNGRAAILVGCPESAAVPVVDDNAGSRALACAHAGGLLGGRTAE